MRTNNKINEAMAQTHSRNNGTHRTHFTHLITSQKSAFTLAETLITLAIIGVVAAMTIPSLVQKYQERVAVTKLKKAYSVVMNAYNLAIAEHGTFDTWGMQNVTLNPDDGSISDEGYDSINKFWTNLLPYMKVDEICLAGDDNCSIFKDDTKMYSLDGGSVGRNLSEEKFTAIRLHDGTILWGGFISSANCNNVRGSSRELQHVCGDFAIIVSNSGKDKYYYGKDMFYFYITQNSVVPLGTKDNTVRSFSEHCNINGNNQYNGYGCTAWVVTNGNMDYLRRDDLEW